MLFVRPILKYADFRGRARRAEYWSFWLFQVILYTILVFLLISGFSGGRSPAEAILGAFGIIGFMGLLMLALFIPNLAVLARRLHDINLSMWWMALMLPGIVAQYVSFSTALTLAQSAAQYGDIAAMERMMGPALSGNFLLTGIGVACNLVLFVMTLISGTQGPNRFGDDPKGGSGYAPRNDGGTHDRIDAAIARAQREKEDEEPYTPVFDFGPPKAQPARTIIMPEVQSARVIAPASPLRSPSQAWGPPPSGLDKPTFGRRR